MMKKRGAGLSNRQEHAHGYFAREFWIYAILFLILGCIVIKLIWLQVFQAADLKAKGIERSTTAQKVMANRGSILDVNGNVLAQSIPAKQIFANPKMLNDQINSYGYKESKEQIAAKLANLLGIKEADVLNKLNIDVSWVSIAHQVDLDKAAEILSWEIPGFGADDEEKRIYPMGTVASSVLGIIKSDGEGVEGVEAYYDKELRGKSGLDVNQPVNPVSNSGANITLTLDSTIQYLLEQQSDDLMKMTQAKSVTILAMDPMSGKILGMSSRPNFDPNNYSASSAESRRNTAISMSYEPGSTFKIVTGSAALEEGAIDPNDTFDDPGFYRVGPRLITNWDSDQNQHGLVTFTRGMELSSNVVLAQVGQKLGKNNFYTFLKAFGFGQKTGIDIAGEESGLLVPFDKARDIELATMSFGQANLVTPIQLLTAISAVANGGTLYQPYIVDKISSPDGTVLLEKKPQAVRQVLSKATAAQMTQILEQVVDEGTGALAAIPGIKVAGKTGTAQKVDPTTGQYSSTDYIASFAAFAPAESPKIALLIVIDSPKGGHQGGTLGGPRAKVIIQGAMQYYGIPVAQDTPSNVNASVGPSIVRPSPKEVTPERVPVNGETVVPDLTGLTIRQAGEALGKAELHYNFTGTGFVQQQNPQAGKVVTQGTVIEIKLSSNTNGQ